MEAADGRYTKVGDLQVDDVVCAWNRFGRTYTTVVQVLLHPQQRQTFCQLRSACGSVLLVTDSHRVTVLRGGRKETIEAGALRVGQHVCCSSGEQVLIEVERVNLAERVVQITFFPDIDVEVFNVRSAILTRGHKESQKRRGKKGTSCTWDIKTNNSWD